MLKDKTSSHLFCSGLYQLKNIRGEYDRHFCYFKVWNVVHIYDDLSCNTSQTFGKERVGADSKALSGEAKLSKISVKVCHDGFMKWKNCRKRFLKALILQEEKCSSRIQKKKRIPDSGKV